MRWIYLTIFGYVAAFAYLAGLFIAVILHVFALVSFAHAGTENAPSGNGHVSCNVVGLDTSENGFATGYIRNNNFIIMDTGS